MKKLSNTTKTAVNVADIPNTVEDMEALFKWKHGDTIRGSHAKENKLMAGYRNDIDKDWGTEDQKKVFFVDTFSTKKLVSESLKEKS